MSEFILKCEGFSLGIIEKVPTPDEEECFLLYQSGAGINNSMIINNGIKYSSTKIRHGKYNKKAVISLKPHTIQHTQKMILKDQNFYFNVSIKLSCSLIDVKKFFFSERLDEEEIHGIIRANIKKFDEKWEIKQSLKAQSELEESLIKKFNQYTGIKFKVNEINVTPDKDAAKMVQSNIDTEVEIHINNNETNEKISKNQQAIRLIDSEHELKGKQIQELATMMNNFGIMGPVVDEYLQGNMSGTELYDRIIHAKTNDISMLTTAVAGDMLTDKEIVKKLNEIIADTKYIPVKSENGDSNKRIEEKDIEMNKVEEDGNTESISLSDGDYL